MPKLATIQFAPLLGDKLANLTQLSTLVQEASQNGAHLVVAPELATSGYSLTLPEARKVAEPISEDSPTLKGFLLISKKLNIHIVWGMVESETGTGHLYNSQVLVCPDGRFESMRKINLAGDDWLWASEGRANPPITVCNLGGKSVKVGLLICRDIRDKKDEHWDSFYQKGDADVVAFSAAWGEGFFPATTWMDFVKDNKVTLVVSNRYGVEGTKPNTFDGGICIIKPKGSPEHPNGVCSDGLIWNANCVVYGELGSGQV